MATTVLPSSPDVLAKSRRGERGHSKANENQRGESKLLFVRSILIRDRARLRRRRAKRDRGSSPHLPTERVVANAETGQTVVAQIAPSWSRSVYRFLALTVPLAKPAWDGVFRGRSRPVDEVVTEQPNLSPRLNPGGLVLTPITLAAPTPQASALRFLLNGK
jgi:hypothetical protein